MALKFNPIAVQNKWKLSDAWMVSYQYASSRSSAGTQSLRWKRVGQVTHMSFTTKGQIEGKSQVLLLVNTSKQQPKELPFGLQVDKLCLNDLNSQDKQTLPAPKEKVPHEKTTRGGHRPARTRCCCHQ